MEQSYKIYLQALRFEDSAALLFKYGSNEPNKYFIPAWVNAVFSLELYLKSILQYEKGTIKVKKRGKESFTHSIEGIFHELSDESKVKIEHSFLQDVFQNPPQGLQEIEKHSGSKISNDFALVIKDLSKLFVDFRYIFEQKSETKSFIFIDNIRRAIKNRVTEVGIDQEIATSPK